MRSATRLALFNLGPELADAEIGVMGATHIDRGTQTKLGGRRFRLETTSLSAATGFATGSATPLLLNGVSYEVRVTCSGRTVTNAGNNMTMHRSTAQNSGVEGTAQFTISGPGVFRAVILGTATLDTLTMATGLSGGSAAVVGDTWDVEVSIRRIS
jgi:hypothetical protein